MLNVTKFLTQGNQNAPIFSERFAYNFAQSFAFRFASTRQVYQLPAHAVLPKNRVKIGRTYPSDICILPL